MANKPSKDTRPQYASPACYAGEVDPDYLWAPDPAPKGGAENAPARCDDAPDTKIR